MSGIGRFLALAAIRGYQRWLSPYKGYSCAFRAATGGESCSAYGHRVIGRFGLRRGLGLLDRRLALCGHVHRRMRPDAPPAAAPMMRYRQQGHCDVPCDSPGCDGPGCHGPDCHGPGCHGPDLGRACDWSDACDFCDARDCWRSRRDQAARRNTAQMDAIARRVRDQRQRRRNDEDGRPS